MTDLIPLDTAIRAVNVAIWKSPINAQISTIDASNDTAEALRAIPTIDPAAIREAALREALKALDNLPEYGSPDVNIGVSNAYSAILTMIGEKK